jgi:thiol-disulfide isomerase/thioredoxin
MKNKSAFLGKLIIILTLFLPVALLQSQSAPDFTITDSQGIVRSLYADHLNQGQTVVIKIFFTSCPPCISISDDFQQLYEDWGEGQYDVEFIELSNKTWDSNQDVANYQSSKGITFIGAGNDGGSVAAVNLFTDGSFGQFTGTPTFIVIAPDGSVNFGVTGQGNSGKIVALDQAITATGATGGNQAPDYTSFQINIKDIYGNALNNHNVFLRSAANPSSTYNVTDLTSGSLQFDYPSTMFPEMSEPELFISTSTISSEGISGSDIVIMQRHILGLTPISNPLLVKAADINNNGSVSAADAVQLINVILGLTPTFSNNEFWRYYFESCNNCEIIELPSALGQTLELNVIGVRTGDVNY